jgi:hypothetical protein
MKRLFAATLVALVSSLGAHAQGGGIGNNSSAVLNASGQPMPGVLIAVCQPFPTIAAQITNNVAVLTFATNPASVGFVAGMQVTVSGFTGGDTVFNVSSTILSVTPTTLTYTVTAANRTASTSGQAFQTGDSQTSCAAKSSIYQDPTLTILAPNPITVDALGNWNVWAIPGLYYGQFYGPGLTPVVKQYAVTAVVAGSTNGTVTQVATAGPLNGGPITSTGTLGCPTCIVSASAIPQSKVAVGLGGAQGVQGLDTLEVHAFPAANCNGVVSGTVGGAGWSIGAGGTATCRQGTNNKSGFISITDTAATFATFLAFIPSNWDNTTNPFIRLMFSSTDANVTHTVIPSFSVACYTDVLSTTDDVAPNATRSLPTVTLTGANRMYTTVSLQMNGTDMTGCSPGAMMQVTIGRATDTATNAEFYMGVLSFPVTVGTPVAQ